MVITAWPDVAKRRNVTKTQIVTRVKGNTHVIKDFYIVTSTVLLYIQSSFAITILAIAIILAITIFSGQTRPYFP